MLPRLRIVPRETASSSRANAAPRRFVPLRHVGRPSGAPDRLGKRQSGISNRHAMFHVKQRCLPRTYVAHRRSVPLSASSRRTGHPPDALRRSGARKRQSPEPSLPGAGRPALCITRDDFSRLALFLGKQRHSSRANATPVFHVKHRPARGRAYVCCPSARSSGTPVRSKAGMYFSSAEESSCTKPSSRPRAKRWSTTSSYSSCARRRSS